MEAKGIYVLLPSMCEVGARVGLVGRPFGTKSGSGRWLPAEVMKLHGGSISILLTSRGMSLAVGPFACYGVFTCNISLHIPYCSSFGAISVRSAVFLFLLSDAILCPQAVPLDLKTPLVRLPPWPSALALVSLCWSPFSCATAGTAQVHPRLQSRAAAAHGDVVAQGKQAHTPAPLSSPARQSEGAGSACRGGGVHSRVQASFRRM